MASFKFSTLVGVAVLASRAFTAPVDTIPTTSVTNVTIGSSTYTYQRQVGFGTFSPTALDFLGDTIGGVGSALAIRPGSFRRNLDGTYQGTLTTQPDRGHNGAGAATVDYAARQLYFDFVLRPYYGDDANGGVGSVNLTYKGGLVYKDPRGPGDGRTTGFDPTGFRNASGTYGVVPTGPNGKISVDAEGLAYDLLGNFWVSDEYGPNVYYVGRDGTILASFQPPLAIQPLDATGKLNFTALVPPTTGRINNQGFEGLSISQDGRRLYVGLQSGTVQDGGPSGPLTRLLEYDVTIPIRPRLTKEWVVRLPQKANGDAYAQSEIYYVKDNLFFVLARDGKGLGSGTKASDLTSAYKNIGLVDTSAATNIAGTGYDAPSNPVSPGRNLAANITAATFTPFINLLDTTQLARFGLHNGPPLNSNVINGKFESIAIASALDVRRPNDYFIFTLSDNDFITLNGISVGQPYSDNAGGIDVPTQLLVYRVTLPSIQPPLNIYG